MHINAFTLVGDGARAGCTRMG